MNNHPSATYAEQPETLNQQVVHFLQIATTPRIGGTPLALIVPDANVLAGGPIAASVYQLLANQTIDTVILITPSHQGTFERISISQKEQYAFTLGRIPINDFMRNELCDEEDDIYLDDTGDDHVAGISVQLPYLHHMLDGFDIVPIVMGTETPEYCNELGQALSEVMYARKVLLVTTADVLQATPETLNTFSNAFESLDVSRLMALMNSNTVKIKGKGGILSALRAALDQRANHAKIITAQLPQNGTPGFIGGVIWRDS